MDHNALLSYWGKTVDPKNQREIERQKGITKQICNDKIKRSRERLI